MHKMSYTTRIEHNKTTTQAICSKARQLIVHTTVGKIRDKARHMPYIELTASSAEGWITHKIALQQNIP